jgi:hypothetical protein
LNVTPSSSRGVILKPRAFTSGARDLARIATAVHYLGFAPIDLLRPTLYHPAEARKPKPELP